MFFGAAVFLATFFTGFASADSTEGASVIVVTVPAAGETSTSASAGRTFATTCWPRSTSWV